jgi:transglutaminase-like putative cysteine protease
MGLPARYTSGYLRTAPPPGKPRLVGADVSHAWCAAWCGPLGWIDFDPTNNRLVDDSYVTVAWGRDYSDVCPIQGVFVGGGEHRMGVSVDVAPLPDE